MIFHSKKIKVTNVPPEQFNKFAYVPDKISNDLNSTNFRKFYSLWCEILTNPIFTNSMNIEN
jgi:hypothetical protein